MTEDARRQRQGIFRSRGRPRYRDTKSEQGHSLCEGAGRRRDGERIAKLAHAIPGGKALIIGAYRLLDRINLAPWFSSRRTHSTRRRISPTWAASAWIPPSPPIRMGQRQSLRGVGKLTQKEGHHGIRSQASLHNFKVTLDERIADGLYFARSASCSIASWPTRSCWKSPGTGEGYDRKRT